MLLQFKGFLSQLGTALNKVEPDEPDLKDCNFSIICFEPDHSVLAYDSPDFGVDTIQLLLQYGECASTDMQNGHKAKSADFR